jgi:Tfp pilus assembly PilM family ATPase
MAQKFVGVDLGTHHVKVVVVHAKLRGVQVVDAFEEPVGYGAEQDHRSETAGEGTAEKETEARDPLSPVISVALGMLRSRGLLNESMGVALPAGSASYRVLSFPFSDERRIAQAVGFEAEGQFPVSIDELVHGHSVIPAPDGGRALLAAAKRARVEQIAAVFKRAGADLKAITPGPIATAHVTAANLPAASPEMTEQGREPVALLVDVGHGHTQFVALGPKGPLAVRTLRRGGLHITRAIAARYGMDLVAAEAAKHADAFLPHRGFESITSEQLDAGKLIATALEEVVKEIEQTRLWLRATYRWEVCKVILAGGGAALTGIDAYLGEHTGLPVEPLAIGGVARVQAATVSNATTTAAALGAAYGAARRPLVQLFERDGAANEGKWLQERVSSLIAIGVAVMAFGALDTIAQVKAVDAEKAAYLAELEEATRKVFGVPLKPDGVAAELARVEGQDLTSLIPERGALEVLALVTKAATPTDLEQAAQDAAAAGALMPMAPGLADEDGDEGDDDDSSAAEPMAPASSGPVDPSRGIVVADELTFGTVDLRERKIELRASSNTSSAQDRLNKRLQQIGCLSNIQNGKVKGDARKSFDMTMDNQCYKAPASEATANGVTGDDD